MKNYEIISKYRSALMGLAILWIVIYHSAVKLPFPAELVRSAGYGGCDIFLFLSGLGIYVSLSRNGDAAQFYKRRLLKTAPSYFPVFAVWFVYFAFVSANGFRDGSILSAARDFFGNILMYGTAFDLDNQFNWYIQAIVWLYIFSPLFYRLLSVEDKRKKIINIAVVTAALAAVNIVCLAFDVALIAASRTFVFLLGMITADLGKRKENSGTVPAVMYIAMTGGLAVLGVSVVYFPEYLWRFGLYWYPFIFITPGLCLLLSRIFELAEKTAAGKKINAAFKFLGSCSLEIYLINVLFSYILNDRFAEKMNALAWAAAIVINVAAGIFYNRLINAVKGKIGKRKTDKIAFC